MLGGPVPPWPPHQRGPCIYLGKRVECLTNFLNYVSEVIHCPRRNINQDLLELNEDVVMDARSDIPVDEWHSMSKLTGLGQKVVDVLYNVLTSRKFGEHQVHLDIHKSKVIQVEVVDGNWQPVDDNHKPLLRNLIAKFEQVEPLSLYGFLYNAVSILHPVARYCVPI